MPQKRRIKRMYEEGKRPPMSKIQAVGVRARGHPGRVLKRAMQSASLKPRPSRTISQIAGSKKKKRVRRKKKSIKKSKK